MNQFTVLVLLLVVFCYCGGKYCPAVLKQNKQILLGVVGGLVLASFFGVRLEGMANGSECSNDQDCDSGFCNNRGICADTGADEARRDLCASPFMKQLACSSSTPESERNYWNTTCPNHRCDSARRD